ncbi:prolipoprotein diacylglyceryl transferase [Candidatus Uhrbacteria bacterium]|nr:prolipoprotein diacylglyceryl transferase [Candidatus Uhrbacteria bacterium]
MIPYFQSLTYSLGPLTLQTWGTFVAAGFLVGGWIAAARAKRMRLDPNMVWEMLTWVFLAAMVGSRLFHVVFYEPAYYLLNPWQALNPFAPGYAIMGGLFGGAGAVWFFVKRKGLDFLAYADTMAWGLPWGCGIGRIGCFLIHDHPGTLTSFVGGVRYPDGKVRHDLGLYLSIVGFLIGALFLILDRFPRLAARGSRLTVSGFWVGAFLLADAVTRFGLDFLRVADRRYSGLTPTQWAVLFTGALGIWLLMRTKRTAS